MSDDRHTSPYDKAWSLLGSSLIGAAIAVYLLLSIGKTQLFDGSVGQPDGAVVAAAYYGAFLLSAGLFALAVLALAAQSDPDRPVRPGWPRFRPFEDDAGRRPRLLARASLASVTVIPLSATITCLIRYLKRSHVTLWKQDGSLPDGFFASRVAAYAHDCAETLCFGMHPGAGAPQWFYWSDPLLACAMAAAVGAWATFAARTIKR